MQTRKSTSHFQGEENQFRNLVEEAQINSRSLGSYIREIMNLIRYTTGIADLHCEIHDRVIAMNRSEAESATSISQPDKSTVLSKIDEAVYKAEWRSEPTYQTSPAAQHAHRGRKIESPITYGNKTIGTLFCRQSSLGDKREAEQRILAVACQYIAYAIQRYEVGRWSQERFGRDFALVGVSKKLHEIEQLIERLSSSILPVLIDGEFGTEKLNIAIAIHATSNRKDFPFVDIDCSNPLAPLEDCLARARSGSVCLNNIHRLNLRQQLILQSQMHSHLGQWLGNKPSEDVRILAISDVDLRELVREGIFLPSLYAELSFLTLSVSPLRERKDDIVSIVSHLLSEFKVEQSCSLHEEAYQLLGSHHWPGNLFEIRKLMASLIVLSTEGEITARELLAHAPWLGQSRSEPNANEMMDVTFSGEDEVSTKLEHWLQEFIGKATSEQDSMHDGLRQAILHLVDHYADPISLNDLAQVAHLSSSYLSFLFRDGVNASFKDIQQCIRITKAKELLREKRQMPIAQIAVSVGYADLSHFERSFRRRVGMRPRDYRRLHD